MTNETLTTRERSTPGLILGRLHDANAEANRLAARLAEIQAEARAGVSAERQASISREIVTVTGQRRDQEKLISELKKYLSDIESRKEEKARHVEERQVARQKRTKP